MGSAEEPLIIDMFFYSVLLCMVMSESVYCRCIMFADSLQYRTTNSLVAPSNVCLAQHVSSLFDLNAFTTSHSA
jgi:hypothetical protein